jgi:hypothetical protein
MAIEVAGEAADDDKSETKSMPGDHADACNGNENAMPGYDNTYMPLEEGLS